MFAKAEDAAKAHDAAALRLFGPAAEDLLNFPMANYTDVGFSQLLLHHFWQISHLVLSSISAMLSAYVLPVFLCCPVDRAVIVVHQNHL